MICCHIWQLDPYRDGASGPVLIEIDRLLDRNSKVTKAAIPFFSRTLDVGLRFCIEGEWAHLRYLPNRDECLSRERGIYLRTYCNETSARDFPERTHPLA